MSETENGNGMTPSGHGPSAAAASLSREVEDWRNRYFEARDALFQFEYPPDPKLLREIADEIDCGNDCEHGHTEWDTNAHVCSRADSKDGCASEKASCLRQFADAIDASSRLQPAAAVERASREDVEYRYPTYDQLIAELAACRDVATAASGHDDTDAIADPLQVADHVSLALGIPPEHRKSHTPPLGEGKAVARDMPAYGRMSFAELGRDVNEATMGRRSDFDFGESYPGHVMLPGVNFNSLNRIVSKYASPPPSREGKAVARVETGIVQFDDDWPGVFIRGDNAFHYASHLRTVLSCEGGEFKLSEMIVKGLLQMLERSNVQAPNHGVDRLIPIAHPTPPATGEVGELIAHLIERSRWRNERMQCIADPTKLEAAASALARLPSERDAAREEEREACAKIADYYRDHSKSRAAEEKARDIAEDIRARSALPDSGGEK